MSTLTRVELDERLKDKTAKGLVLTPILSPKQLGDLSIDVRLANQFIVFRAHTLPAFDPYEGERANLRKMQQRQVVPYGEPFVLHPGSLSLGATFEYLSMPDDLECKVEGRSSWARIGLQVATATVVEPGFRGVVTLELSNVGTIPIVLRPGVRIAQLVFRTTSSRVIAPYGERRKYVYPVGPQFSRIHTDRDGRMFTT